jgi:hypothetical protein
VRDHIVELARDPPPFLTCSLLRASFAIALGPVGTSLKRGHVRDPPAHRLAHQPGSQEKGGCPAEVRSSERLAMVDSEREIELEAANRVEESDERAGRSA